ncbi:MbtH family NRPS accessory protein [Streptosporangium sp. CA-115845]|uniref:MbtH family NRPS accessory protein n=1 Tax=Streptosporangium sp. CA-115845 TaxID=3240071 RepID=UPI003D89B815
MPALSDDGAEYTAVRDVEARHSIRPVGKALPSGGLKVGPRGGRAECPAHISEVRTNRRPLSPRQAADGTR